MIRLRYSWLIFLPFALLSCQQLRFESQKDYSGFLPPGQLLYLSFRISAGDEFPYKKFAAQILQKGALQKFAQKFVVRRLIRSQIAIGVKGEIYALNQMLLKPRLFHNQMKRQKGWQRNAQSYYNQDLALQMPQPNLLYLTQGNAKGAQQSEQNNFAQAWAGSEARNRLPQVFRSLQERHPVAAYSPAVLPLLGSPALQRAFPQTVRALNPFIQIGAQIPLGGLLAWIETAGDRVYALHLQLETNSLLLSKGLETGLRLVLPSLLQRSKQKFIQLADVRIESTNQHLNVQIPLDEASLLSIAERLPITFF